jgi:AcrR family transcriptional regulator
MPGLGELWTDTVDAHRQQVRDAILDAVAALVDEQGLLAVTMSAVAERAGIGRATLYKYFPDVQAILIAWHDRQVASHLDQLSTLAAQPGSALDRLEAVLTGHAHIARASHGHDPDVSDLLHRGRRLSQTEQALHELVTGLLAQASVGGEIRTDIASNELATYCLHALTAAAQLPSKAAVHRLVQLTLSSVRGHG